MGSREWANCGTEISEEVLTHALEPAWVLMGDLAVESTPSLLQLLRREGSQGPPFKMTSEPECTKSAVSTDRQRSKVVFLPIKLEMSRQASVYSYPLH